MFMPDAQINQMGIQAFDTLKKEKSVSNNSQYNQVANCTSQAITTELGGNWEVVVFEDSSPNAFALPGNKIGIHTGMLTLVDNQRTRWLAVSVMKLVTCSLNTAMKEHRKKWPSIKAWL